MYIGFFVFFIIFCLSFTYICKKNNLIVDFKLERHKRFSSKIKSNLIGGFFLIIFLIYDIFFINSDFVFSIYIICMFLLGFMSDIKKLNSVALRFIIQVFLIIFFSGIIGLEIETTKINFIDKILSNSIINLLFVTFCLMVLINGGNFIDGLNGLMLKYYLIIYLLIFLYFGHYPSVDQNFLINLIFILILILSLNLLGLIYMGDSGAYLLSLFTGIYLINFSYNNTFISPYFIIVLLWYPCFELLFSMIRRYLIKSKTYKPDALHLHQFIFNFVNRKIFNHFLVSHFFTSLVINIYNLIIFFVAINFIYSSEIQISLLVLNIIFYLFIYSFFKKKYRIDN